MDKVAKSIRKKIQLQEGVKNSCSMNSYRSMEVEMMKPGSSEEVLSAEKKWQTDIDQVQKLRKKALVAV